MATLTQGIVIPNYNVATEDGGVIVSPTPPEFPFEGMLWQDSSVTGANVVYRYNGAQWLIWRLKAENLDVQTLSSITANMGTVNAGTINGVTINGSKFVNTFNNPYLGGTISGTTTIENGLYTTEYTLKNSSGVTQTTGTNKVDYTGIETIMNVNALTTRKITSNYGAEGVVMSDYRYTPTYGIVNLQFQDLMNVSATTITPATGFKQHVSGDATAIRYGRNIQLTGALTTINAIDNSPTVVCTLPVWARPERNRLAYLQQGSGFNIFLLEINNNGQVIIDRYRDTIGSAGAPSTIPAGVWINITLNFVAKNL